MNKAYDVQIIAFVLMSNHFHLLAQTPLANLSQAMCTFMRETSRQITKAAHRINQAYGQRHFRCVLTNNRYFSHSYKYVYLNPVKAKLCERAEDYPYSTLNGLLGRRRLLIPVVEDLVLMEDVEDTLSWINYMPNEKNWETVRKALRKPEFKLAKDPATNRPHSLEEDWL